MRNHPDLMPENGNIWQMSDHEKYEQVGRLAEEVSDIKGKLAHVTEKLNRAQADYSLSGQILQQLQTHDGKLIIPATAYGQHGRQPRTLDGLLNTHELIQVLEEKERLANELKELSARLRALAPHLL